MQAGFPRLWKQTQLFHDTEHALWAAGIALLPQKVPQFHHAEAGVSAAHVPDQPQLHFCALIGMAVGPPGLTGQGCHASIPAGFSKYMYDLLLLYFRLARLTPYFSTYFIRNCRYVMSCAILLLMKDMAPSRQVVVCNSNYKLMRPYPSPFFLLLFKIYCNPTWISAKQCEEIFPLFLIG